MGENSSGFVSNSYSTGFVDDTGHKTGGFTGTNGENGLIENSVYNIEISGQSYGCGGNQNCSGVEGVTTNGMKQKAKPLSLPAALHQAWTAHPALSLPQATQSLPLPIQQARYNAKQPAQSPSRIFQGQLI